MFLLFTLCRGDKDDSKYIFIVHIQSLDVSSRRFFVVCILADVEVGNLLLPQNLIMIQRVAMRLENNYTSNLTET